VRSSKTNSPEITWAAPVAVADIPEDGAEVAIEASEADREVIARVAGLRDLPRLAASFHLSPAGHGEVRVAGHVSAVVGQTCVVTLERVENLIEEPVDLIFAPAEAVARRQDAQADDAGDDPPEPMVDGKIDLARLAVEFLILGIDPYPRKSGATFETIHAPVDPADHPFAGLASLKPPAERG
jgi:uncharacterized metal-binding protein YceD (DUF177 family)